MTVKFSYAHETDSLFRKSVINTVETLSGRRRLYKLYKRWQGTEYHPFDEAVRLLRLSLSYNASQLAKIPKDGPVLFIANHPYGVIDGIVLSWIIERCRTDFKILTHALLCQADEIKPYMLPIDFSGTKDAAKTSAKSRKAAVEWLNEGHAVGIFPAGAVSTSIKAHKGPAIDPPWHSFTTKIIRKARPTVVPLLFIGQNSRLFHIASHLSYTLRTSLLFRETNKLIGNEIKIKIGDPIPYEQLVEYEETGSLLPHLRRTTFSLNDEQPGLADLEFNFPKWVNIT